MKMMKPYEELVQFQQESLEKSIAGIVPDDGLAFDHMCLTPNEINVVIFHGSCPDGQMADTIAHRYFELNGLPQPFHFAAHFDCPPPRVIGKNVLIVDFCYPYETTTKILANANKLAIIDHHKGNAIEIDTIPDENKTFNMNFCGAYMAWRFFFPIIPVPRCVLYYQDQDLFIRTLPNTRNFTAYSRAMLKFNVDDYKKTFDDSFIDNEMIPNGKGIVLLEDHQIEEALKHPSIELMRVDDIYYMIAFFNSTVLKSEVGNAALTRYKHIDFSAIYSQDDGRYYFSLRSDNAKSDVQIVAKYHGGNGHRNAAGMSYGTSILNGNRIAGYELYKSLRNIYLRSMTAIGTEPDVSTTYTFAFLNFPSKRKHIAKWLMQTSGTKLMTVAHSICANNEIMPSGDVHGIDGVVVWCENYTHRFCTLCTSNDNGFKIACAILSRECSLEMGSIENVVNKAGTTSFTLRKKETSAELDLAYDLVPKSNSVGLS